MFFAWIAAGTWNIFSCFGGDNPSQLLFVQRRQESCVVMKDTSGISMRLGRGIQTLFEVRWETEGAFPVATMIFGFLIILRMSQASSPFEAMKSAHLSMCQKDVRPTVQKSWRTMAFSRVSTGDSVTLHLVR